MSDSIYGQQISEVHNQKWMDRYLELKMFKKSFDHCNVPQKWNDNPALSYWVKWQRKMYKRQHLLDWRKKLLDKIKFEWEMMPPPIKRKSWQERFNELVAFKKKYGHADVPIKWEKNKTLGGWVSEQRANKSHLSKDRIKLLDTIKFTWKVQTTSIAPWAIRYQQLLEFHKKFGHCIIPRTAFYKVLANWARVQRRNWEKGLLAPERIKKMEELNFDWIVKGSENSIRMRFEKTEKEWNIRYDQLVEFKKRFGHYKVPSNWKENTSLKQWIYRQFFLYKNNKLPQNRLLKLHPIFALFFSNTKV